MSDEGERLLGVDLGDVRIGLALSDLLALTAQPLEAIQVVGPRRDAQRIEEAVREHGVRTVVVGLPLRLSGEEGERCTAAREFAERLRRRLEGVDVLLWDERMTTVQAERTLVSGGASRRKRREKIDSLAAVLILQSYLDTRSSEVSGVR